MGLTVAYWVHCDLCGEGPGSSKPTMEEAYEYVDRSEWRVFRGYGVVVCDECLAVNPTPHPQYSNTFCVLCQSGEHTAVTVMRK